MTSIGSWYFACLASILRLGKGSLAIDYKRAQTAMTHLNDRGNKKHTIQRSINNTNQSALRPVIVDSFLNAIIKTTALLLHTVSHLILSAWWKWLSRFGKIVWCLSHEAPGHLVALGFPLLKSFSFHITSSFSKVTTTGFLLQFPSTIVLQSSRPTPYPLRQLNVVFNIESYIQLRQSFPSK